MKLIITGVTGFVGSECLRQALKHPKITSVVALTRRPLADSQAKDVDQSNPKLQVIVQEDLTSYTPDILAKLDGSDACIWSLGTVPRKHQSEETKRTAIEIPQAAINAWNGKLKHSPGPFRFVYVSGAAVRRSQEADTSMIPGFVMNTEFMKLRGETENMLARAEESSPDAWKAFMLRMGKVLNADANLLGMVVPSWGFIKVNEAALCMLDLALNGGDKQTLSNADMVALGKKAFAAE